MKILICDSDNTAILSLVKLIRSKYTEAGNFVEILIDTAHNYEETLSAMNMTDTAYDIIFIDVVLGNESGIPLAMIAKSRFPDARIIFDSADARLCELIYVEMQPYAFVNKPFNAEIIYHHIDNVNDTVNGADKSLELFSNRQRYSIALKRITFIESDRNKVTVHFGSESITVISTLKEIETQLNDNFIKCHKSFIVNLAYIVSVEQGDFLLATGEKVPVSRSRITQSKYDFMMYKGGII
ncbi:MAG: response regulator transcription factor [Clostridia bacterium]|nr:response regulator transcription factor [Clostridia bacterium]